MAVFETVLEIIGWASGVISIIALLVAGVIATRCEWLSDSTDEDDKNI